MTKDLDDVDVDPGDIDEFAKTMTELADYWMNESGGPHKLAYAKKDDYHYPKLGEFGEADQFLNGHHGKWTSMAVAFHQLNALLEGLHDGTKKVAEEYRSLEALNSADADSLDSLIEPQLRESMQDVPQSQSPAGPNGNQPPGQTPNQSPTNGQNQV